MGVGFLMILQPSHILKVHIRASCQFQWEENFWKIWRLQWNLIFLCKCPSSDTINQSMKVKRQGYIYKVHISITLFYFISQTETDNFTMQFLFFISQWQNFLFPSCNIYIHVYRNFVWNLALQSQSTMLHNV